MTPHGAIEDIGRIRKALGSNLAKVFDVNLLENVERLLPMAAHFDYGKTNFDGAHTEFGQDLFKRGLFRLPFDVVFFTSNMMPRSAILATQRVAQAPELGEEQLFLFTFGPTMLGDDPADCVELEGLPLMAAGIDSNHQVRWKCLTSEGYHRRRTTGEMYKDKDFEESVDKAVNFLLGATALLMSKEVVTEHIPAPDKLNKRRAQKGKPPLVDRHVVRLNPAAHRALGTGTPIDGRASPRMHWRRGHFRHIREDLILPIPPTIVNAQEGVTPRLKTYLLSGAK